MMASAQHSLLGPAPTPFVKVIEDYGPIGKGATNARYVLAENGEEYLVKGPSLVTGIPTVAANEWIAARLATAVGLPTLDHRIVELGDELFFASTYMQKPSFYPAIHEALLDKCLNVERVYGVVVFDAWFCNLDRHQENLVVRRLKRGTDEYLLILNDHSHCLVSPYIPDLSLLDARKDSMPSLYVSLSFVRDRIEHAGPLGDALSSVEALSDADIRVAVQSTPGPLLDQPHRDGYENFLIERRSRLRAAFQRDASSFPNLVGAL